MAKRPKAWMVSPARSSKSSMSDSLKADLETKSAHLIEHVLKPKHVLPLANDEQFNHIIDIGTIWYRNYFYFFSTYACPGPNSTAPTFESKFARLEYSGNDKFNLHFMRHTGKWVALYNGLNVDECLKAIQDDPWFVP
jgi:hypothetical protein